MKAGMANGDTGAALVMLPLFIVLYPLELVSQWERRGWQNRIAQLKQGMTKDEAGKIMGEFQSYWREIEVAADQGEIWRYRVNTTRYSRFSKLRLHFTNGLLDEVAPDHYEKF